MKIMEKALANMRIFRYVASERNNFIRTIPYTPTTCFEMGAIGDEKLARYSRIICGKSVIK